MSGKMAQAVDRLADVVENGHLIAATDGADLLIAAAEEIEALRLEVERWRSQCPVTVDQARMAKVTWSQAIRWAEREGLVPCDPEFGVPDQADGYAMMRMRRPDGPNECDAVFELMDGDCVHSVAYSCNKLSKALGRPPHDILVEMAAEVSP